MRYLSLLLLGFLCSLTTCRQNLNGQYIVFSRLKEPWAVKAFSRGVQKAADSLNVSVTVYEHPESAATFSRAQAVAFSPIDEDTDAQILAAAARRHVPIITFDGKADSSALFYVDVDRYKAGRQTAQFIQRTFGNSGSYLLITTSFADDSANDFIRGFREPSGGRHRRRQLNILTCDQPVDYTALVRRFASLPDKPIWVWAAACPELAKNIAPFKEDNYFIVSALEHPVAVVEMLKAGAFDAVIVKDYQRMGEQVVVHLHDAGKQPVTATPYKIDCGARIMTRTDLNDDGLLSITAN